MSEINTERDLISDEKKQEEKVSSIDASVVRTPGSIELHVIEEPKVEYSSCLPVPDEEEGEVDNKMATTSTCFGFFIRYRSRSGSEHLVKLKSAK